jgi:hypothetical protein
MPNYHYILAVEETKYPENVTAALNTDFIKPVSVFQMLQVNFRYPVQFFDNLQRPKNFCLNLYRLTFLIIMKVVLVKQEVTPFVHSPKVIKVA